MPTIALLVKESLNRSSDDTSEHRIDSLNPFLYLSYRFWDGKK